MRYLRGFIELQIWAIKTIVLGLPKLLFTPHLTLYLISTKCYHSFTLYLTCHCTTQVDWHSLRWRYQQLVWSQGRRLHSPTGEAGPESLRHRALHHRRPAVLARRFDRSVHASVLLVKHREQVFWFQTLRWLSMLDPRWRHGKDIFASTMDMTE